MERWTLNTEKQTWLPLTHYPAISCKCSINLHWIHRTVPPRCESLLLERGMVCIAVSVSEKYVVRMHSDDLNRSVQIRNSCTATAQKGWNAGEILQIFCHGSYTDSINRNSCCGKDQFGHPADFGRSSRPHLPVLVGGDAAFFGGKKHKAQKSLHFRKDWQMSHEQYASKLSWWHHGWSALPIRWP